MLQTTMARLTGLAAERVPEHCDRAALNCCLASLQPDLLSAWHVLAL